MSKYLNYNEVHKGVTIWWNKNPSKRKNAKVKEAIGWTLRQSSDGWIVTNIREEIHTVTPSNFLAWRESKVQR
jgi:hypothetical protein